MTKFGMALAALLLFAMSGVGAQSGNLLQDPSFETPGNFKIVLQSAEEGTIFGVPVAWEGWVLTSPRTETWMNLVPDGYPHTGLFKFDGGRSLSIARGFATFTTAVYQRVTVASGTNLRGSARGFMERGSNPPAGAQFRVGIDPAGGTNPLASSIVWSPWVSSPNSWVQATVDATVTGDAATLFLYSTQSQPSDPNSMYWDDAHLEVGGGGGAAASGTPGSADVLPTPAFAPFVQPQGARPDGSIVHVVVEGDTLDGIAAAYGTTRDALIELNNLTSRNFLMLGQEIMIRPPTNKAVTTGTPDATAGTVVASASRTLTTPDSTSSTPNATESAQSSGTETTPETAEPTATVTPEPTATFTPEPSPTELPPAPVTQVADLGEDQPEVTALCMWMFVDANQNRIQESSEPLLAGGTIEIRSGAAVIETHTTEEISAPFCSEDLAPGDYTAAATAPEGYGLTTAGLLNLRVQESARTNVRFGAAEGVQSITAPPDDTEPEAELAVPEIQEEEVDAPTVMEVSGLILIGLAGVVVLGGIGLALFIRGR